MSTAANASALAFRLALRTRLTALKLAPPVGIGHKSLSQTAHRALPFGQVLATPARPSRRASTWLRLSNPTREWSSPLARGSTKKNAARAGRFSLCSAARARSCFRPSAANLPSVKKLMHLGRPNQPTCRVQSRINMPIRSISVGASSPLCMIMFRDFSSVVMICFAQSTTPI